MGNERAPLGGGGGSWLGEGAGGLGLSLARGARRRLQRLSVGCAALRCGALGRMSEGIRYYACGRRARPWRAGAGGGSAALQMGALTPSRFTGSF